MNQYKLSVIIPTRERCETLIHALKTVTSQCYDNLEIIVSDNFSQDRTGAAVKALDDPRIVYIRTDSRLSMSHNWEFALKHVTGDYVTIIGDDDGLLPGALAQLASLIEKTHIEAIVWRWASYYWPDCILAQSKNTLSIPLSNGVEKRKCSDFIQKVAQFKVGYENLPFFYKGLVSVKAIERVKAASGGIFFHSQTPDLYSAFALSSVMDEYLYSYKPFSINGTSKKSNGASAFMGSLDKSAANEFNAENNIEFHPDAVVMPSIPMITAEVFYQAEKYFPILSQYKMSEEVLIKAIIDDAGNPPHERYPEIKEGMTQLAIRKNNPKYAEAFQGEWIKPAPRRNAPGLLPGHNVRRQLMIIDGDVFGISNIYDAALICGFCLQAESAGYKLSLWSSLKSTYRRLKAMLGNYL